MLEFERVEAVFVHVAVAAQMPEIMVARSDVFFADVESCSACEVEEYLIWFGECLEVGDEWGDEGEFVLQAVGDAVEWGCCGCLADYFSLASYFCFVPFDSGEVFELDAGRTIYCFEDDLAYLDACEVACGEGDDFFDAVSCEVEETNIGLVADARDGFDLGEEFGVG